MNNNKSPSTERPTPTGAQNEIGNAPTEDTDDETIQIDISDLELELR